MADQRVDHSSSSLKNSVTNGTRPQDVDEQALLAAIGSTVQNMDAYESSVIREATLSSAPTLTGIGFPDLERLAPSYDARRPHANLQGDVRHVHNMLRTVRSELASLRNQRETRQSLILNMKEQMLLCFLKKIVKVSASDLPVQVREMVNEQARSKLASNAPSKTASIDRNGGNGFENHGVLKASPAAAASKALHERVSVMKRKTLEMKRHEDDDDDDGDKVGDNSNLQERNNRLKQLREERLERRRKRRQEWYGRDDGDDDDSHDEESDSEQELELDDDNNPKATDDQEQAKTSTIDIVDSASEAEKEDEVDHVFESKKAATITISCPLCQQTMNVDDGMDADAFLSQHINECQQGRRTRSRRGYVQNSDTSTQKQQAVNTLMPSQPMDTRKRKATIAIGGVKSAMSSKKLKRPRIAPSTTAANKATPLDDLEEWAYEDRIDDWVATGLQRMRHMKEQDADELPPGAEDYPGGLFIPAWMNDRLFPYQRTGLRWMWELHLQEAGGIMGDEGLGKTVQLASYLGAMAASRKLKCALVISPATMLRHWLNELATWAPGLRRVLIHQSGEADGSSRSLSVKLLRSLDNWLKKARADRINEPIDEDDIASMDHDTFCGTGYVIVTTYESIRKNTDMWIEHKWSYVVLDEAQKIRNPDADVTLACKRLRTPHRIAMSGTPIQNNLRELWSLLDFVFPGRLGTLPAFEQEFADPIRKGGYSNASPMQVQLAYRCALVLRDLINPYLLRRQKKDVKEVSRMPGKTEHVLFCRLSKRQRAMYEAYIKSDDVIKVLRGSAQLFAAITVLRKICNHPDLVCAPDESSFQSFLTNGYSGEVKVDDDSEDGDTDEPVDLHESFVSRAGKLEVLAKILPLWRKQRHRVLIFCQWKKMLNIIQRFTELQGWKFGRLDGNTNVASRQHLVDTFNKDDSYFGMLCTTRTGGVGLNLTGANRIILYDPDWNPQTDAQARERAWRFGQEREVTVYRLITAGTIEEKIYHRQIFKTALTNKVLQDPRQRRLFTQKDLRDFFTLKADGGSVASGSDGVTETSEITRGVGFVDPDNTGAANGSLQDNEETLRTVMKSKGLAGIFDHDFVEENHTKKTETEREIEEQAKRVARSAVSALRKSVSSQSGFVPTWTGTGETRPQLLALAARGSLGAEQTGDAGQSSLGKGETVGVVSSGSGAGQSSSSLLASLRHRTTPTTGKQANPENARYVELLGKISNYVQRNRPTTDEILQEFDYIESAEAAIFRKLLNSAAKVQDGRWQLRDG